MQYTADYLERRLKGPWDMALITGTGLGGVASALSDALALSYQEIPHFPVSTVEGHEGQLISGTWGGRRLLVMQGRLHYYEGYTLQEITYPVRVLQALGIKHLIITNAAGGLNPDLTEGQLLVIRDHINMMGTNPLIGVNDPQLGPRFVDMHAPYSPRLREVALEEARARGVQLATGVYAGITGPTFQTPAELIFMERLGADAVGMSTVPEVIVARHAGMEVLAISCITDMAVGHDLHPISHEAVMASAARGANTLQKLLPGVIDRV